MKIFIFLYLIQYYLHSCRDNLLVRNCWEGHGNVPQILRANYHHNNRSENIFIVQNIFDDLADLQDGNAPVFLSIEGGGLKECEADHGDGRDNGERSDPSQHDSDDPGEAEDDLEQGRDTDGSLHFSHSLLPDL